MSRSARPCFWPSPTVATAWSGYQASCWNGEQAKGVQPSFGAEEKTLSTQDRTNVQRATNHVLGAASKTVTQAARVTTACLRNARTEEG